MNVMIEVYRAANPIDAHVLRGVLEAEGIEAAVIGEDAFSLRGGTPLTTETLPRVAVAREEDVERARAIVESFDRHTPTPTPAEPLWLCAGCGELIEGQFETCWKCGAARPAR